MNNRLQQFLELENLTPARLADMLGVQRSGLSHILSGRNKPGFEFITRLLSKFPHINSDWLLMGNGKPYKEIGAVNFPASPLPSSDGRSGNLSGNRIQNSQNSISYNDVQYNGINGNGVQYGNVSHNGMQSTSVQYVDEPILDGIEPLNLDEERASTLLNLGISTDNEDINTNIGTSEPSENCANGQNKGAGNKNRRIKRVIVFYSDGSFEELFPHIR